MPSFRFFKRAGGRAGIATSILVLAIVLVVIVAAVGAYYVLVVNSLSSGNSTTTTTFQGSSSTATRSTTTKSTSVSTSSRTTNATAFEEYTGTFKFSNPIGPSGSRLAANQTSAEYYNSVQAASGTFSFFINPANHSGVGSGHGTITVTTTGFCSGQVTVPYNFEIVNANSLFSGNITIAFGEPTPRMVKVPLTCTGPMDNVSAVNNPLPFLSVYPNLVGFKSVPGTVASSQSNISYEITISSGG